MPISQDQAPEFATLGCVLAQAAHDPTAAKECLGSLDPEFFSDYRTRLICTILREAAQPNLHALTTSPRLTPDARALIPILLTPPPELDWSGSPEDFPHHRDALISLATERLFRQSITQISDELAHNSITLSHARESLKTLVNSQPVSPNSWPPPFEYVDQFCATRIPSAPLIIQGLLRNGDKLILGGTSKAQKSWFVLALALAVSAGKPFLDFPTTKTPVLIINLELTRADLQTRLLRLFQALSFSPDQCALRLWNLRGHHASIERIESALAANPEPFGLLILDPLYKVLGHRKENAAEDIGDLMSHIEKIATKHGSAIIFPSHYSKGDQSGKDHMDRISGSGVLARDPDAIITLTAQESDDCYQFQATLRNLPPIRPFSVRWEWPLFVRDSSSDDAPIRKPGRQPFGNDAILAPLKAGPLSYTDWLAALQPSVSSSTFKKYLARLTKDHSVIQCATTSKYYLPNSNNSPSNG